MLCVSRLRSDVGRYPRNVGMLDVSMILQCLCICMFPDYGLMSGDARGMSICFTDYGLMSGRARGMFMSTIPDYSSMSGGTR